MQYSVIYADPPWTWQARSPKGEGRSAKRHYGVMSLDDIMRLPVLDLAEKNSVLFLWATDPLLETAMGVIRAWGFTYKTVGFHWAKLNQSGSGFFTGMGYYSRANVEMCLLATRGKGLPRVSKSVRRLVVAPRGRHSEKPPEVRDRIVQLFGDVLRLEIFARSLAPGWDVWGNEVDGVALPALERFLAPISLPTGVEEPFQNR